MQQKFSMGLRINKNKNNKINLGSVPTLAWNPHQEKENKTKALAPKVARN
jgi:hypothetical protein